MFGNGTPHVHWHLIPRHDSDPHPRGPVWEDLVFRREFWMHGSPIPDARRRADVEIERE